MIAARLADQIGRSPGYVSRLLRGQRTPGIWTILKIEETLRWKAEDQLASLEAGTYAADLATKLREAPSGL